jgi:hypothetical protein
VTPYKLTTPRRQATILVSLVNTTRDPSNYFRPLVNLNISAFLFVTHALLLRFACGLPLSPSLRIPSVCLFYLSWDSQFMDYYTRIYLSTTKNPRNPRPFIQPPKIKTPPILRAASFVDSTQAYLPRPLNLCINLLSVVMWDAISALFGFPFCQLLCVLLPVTCFLVTPLPLLPMVLLLVDP